MDAGIFGHNFEGFFKTVNSSEKPPSFCAVFRQTSTLVKKPSINLKYSHSCLVILSETQKVSNIITVDFETVNML